MVEMSITIETKAGAQLPSRELPWTANDARAAIAELDGSKTTSVQLLHDGSYLWIGGGPDRFTVTYATPNIEKAYSLILNPQAEGTEPRVMGGQRIEQPIRELVSREAAEQAAAEFVETGSVALTREWEDQDRANPST